MPFTPVLTSSTMNLPKSGYTVLHNKKNTAPDSPEIDLVHIHDFLEIYVNLSGDVSFLVDNILCKVERGDIIISRPNQLHMCIYNTLTLHENYCVWIQNSFSGASFVDEKFPSKLSFRGKEAEHLFRSLEKLASGDFPSPLEETTELLSLLCEIKRSGLSLGEKTFEEPKKLFYVILNYIDASPGKISSVNQICENFFISRSTIDRLFSENFQLSPKKYIIYRKLAYAKQLLTSGETVENTAFLCGFPDASRFIVVFKSNFGITPNTYRRQIMQ